ncbi:MAG: hypothetical protein GF317_03490 [Candidatus Lokiarchaeota archaeon]|nr:hypothetical protein [Candidatus Lokiarchaeota archaeon]MBD3198959.1 hypothetical protein [Candidatus Lokiarchaeota archaeon]
MENPRIQITIMINIWIIQIERVFIGSTRIFVIINPETRGKAVIKSIALLLTGASEPHNNKNVHPNINAAPHPIANRNSSVILE